MRTGASIRVWMPAYLARPLSVTAGFLLVIASCLASQSPPPRPQQTVIIKQMHFQPPTLNVQTGDTVKWQNEDIFTHTVTANDGSFDSGPIAPGSSWQTTI